MKRIITLIILAAGLTALNACGGGSGGTKYAGFDFDSPDSLAELNSDFVRVSGSVWSVNAAGDALEEESPAEDALLTIRGHYALPITGLVKGDDYQFQLKVYYQADAYEAPSISAATTDEEAPTTIAINAETDASLCPSLDLSPDASLEEGMWLKLCDVTFVATYNGKELIEVAQENFSCADFDADGDAMANLDEIAETVNPYEGDYDGDCAADGSDAFPDDPAEWLDTDGDGIGNNSDSDIDGDDLSNDEEVTAGTDPLDNDSDDDTVIDGFDNCPLDGSSSDQTDTDDDGEGDLCDVDADNDGLSDSDEVIHGTNPADPDSDDDGDNDGTEVTATTNPLDADSDDDGALDGPDVFPLDPTETSDADGDEVGDNADHCDTGFDPTNADTDGDGEGDVVCDNDDDGDDISDTTEGLIGSDPLDNDTDDDGLIDWFGGTQDGSDDPCLLDAGAAGSDGDGDGFGAACDLSDNPATDPNADLVHFAAIFVDGAGGDDANDGSRASPVKTLEKAIELSLSADLDVYASGDFALSSTLALEDGVMIYGGFASGFGSRNPSSDVSTISSTSLVTLIEATGPGESGTPEGSGLDGFDVENNLSTAGSPVAILVSGNASVTLRNNAIVVTNSSHGTALDAAESELILEDNDIEVSGGTNIGIGIRVNEVTGSFSDNNIEVASFTVSRTGIQCIASGSGDIAMTGNIFDVWAGSAAEATNLIYVRDCVVDSNRNHTAVPIADWADWDGFAADGTNVIGDLF